MIGNGPPDFDERAQGRTPLLDFAGRIDRQLRFDPEVRMWHYPDLQRCPQFGRYRVKTGHGADNPNLVEIDPLRNPQLPG
jgi:hypothetical protein